MDRRTFIGKTAAGVAGVAVAGVAAADAPLQTAWEPREVLLTINGHVIPGFVDDAVEFDILDDAADPDGNVLAFCEDGPVTIRLNP